MNGQQRSTRPSKIRVFFQHIHDCCWKPSSSVSKVASSCSDSVCTNFDKGSVSAHALVVLSMSASILCFVLLSQVCSLLTVPPCHPSHHPSHPQQPDKHSTNCCSHVSSSKVLQRPPAPRVPRNRRTIALLPGKRLT